MYAVCVMFRMEPSEARRFIPLIKENARKTLELEEGCRRFDICTDDDRPDEVFLYELYNSPDAFALHKASDHYAHFDASVSGMVVEKTVRTYSLVT